MEVVAVVGLGASQTGIRGKGGGAGWMRGWDRIRVSVRDICMNDEGTCSVGGWYVCDYWSPGVRIGSKTDVNDERRLRLRRRRRYRCCPLVRETQ